MTDHPRATFEDYLRLLRNYWVLIVALTIVAGGVAAAVSLTRQKVYLSEAQLSFQEEARSNALAGVVTGQPQTAEELAAQGADTVLSQDVLERTRRALGTTLTTAQLRRRVSTSVDSATNLVTVRARSDSAGFASHLADAISRTAVESQTTAERLRFEEAADRVEAQFKSLEQGKSRNDALAVSFYDKIASLRTLSVNATPVSLAKPAVRPNSPASPNPLRDTLFGLIGGLFLGVVVAFVRTAVNPRLTSSEEIQSELSLPIAGTIRRNALGQSAFGGNDLGPMDDQDLESFRILRTNLEFLGDESPPGSFAVTSAMPEEGKSTVAASLALVFAATGRAVLLIEGDLRRPCLKGRLGLEHREGLADVLTGAATIDDVIQHVKLPDEAAAPVTNGKASSATTQPGGSTLDVLAAGSHLERPAAELLGTRQFRRLVEAMTARYDVVVVDTPPMLSVADTLEILPLVDGVLLCVRTDQTTRAQARAVKLALDRLPDRPTTLVVTGAKPRSSADYGYYSYTQADES